MYTFHCGTGWAGLALSLYPHAGHVFISRAILHKKKELCIKWSTNTFLPVTNLILTSAFMELEEYPCETKGKQSSQQHQTLVTHVFAVIWNWSVPYT